MNERSSAIAEGTNGAIRESRNETRNSAKGKGNREDNNVKCGRCRIACWHYGSSGYYVAYAPCLHR